MLIHEVKRPKSISHGPQNPLGSVFLFLSINCQHQVKANKNVKYVRVYEDSTGEPHFEDLEIEFTSVDFAPPAPPLNVSEFTPATHCYFISAPPGWYGDWHPTPRRQIFSYLSGEVEVKVSDGEIRRFGTGSMTITVDTTGKGHTSRVVSSHDALLAVVPLEKLLYRL